MGLRDAWKVLFQRADAPTTRPTRGEIGFTGNKIFSGLPMDEYNPDLAFPLSTTVYDQMRRSDGQVAAVLSAMKQPILSANWFVEPDPDAKSKSQAEEIAEFIEDNLLRGMRYSWADHLREGLLMLDFGFSVFERCYRFDTWNGRHVVMLDKYAPRIAPSIWRFPQNEKTGDIVAVEQLNAYTGEIYTMPLSKCRIYTYQREGDNPVGISALRAAYKHWYYKDSLYKILAVGTEKSLVGTPYATMPVGSSDQDRQQVLQVLTAIRTAEEAGFTIPEGITLSILEGKNSAVNAMPLLEHHDTLIAKSLLAQFLQLGTLSSSSSGSYALGNTMVGMFVMGLTSIADYIAGEIQRDIEELVAWNFGKDAPVPKLAHGVLQVDSAAERMTAIAALGAGHLLNPDESLENALRKMMGVPPIPEAALANQRSLPQTNYVPPIIPDTRLTPAQIAQIQQQQASIGQTGKGPMAAPPSGGTKPGKPGDKVQASEDDESFTFADDPTQSGGGATSASSGGSKWARDVTAFESADAVARLERQWKHLEQQWIDRLTGKQKSAARALVDQVKDSVLSRVNEIMQTNAVNQIQVPVTEQQAYQTEIEQLMQQSYRVGAKTAAQELGITGAITAMDAQVLATIEAKAHALAENQMGRLRDAVKFAVLDQISKQASTARTIAAAKQAAAQYTGGEDLKLSAMVSVGEALNIGRAKCAIELGVQAGQWSAILDNHTCPLCAELDGKVISVHDPDFNIFRPPLHFNCRCAIFWIRNEETGVEYTWKTPDAALVKKYGGFVR